jgi:DNA-binding HxlR family transcriptional regulator
MKPKPNSGRCPVEAISKILGARWTLQILHHLRTPRRFCELQSLVGEINPRTLTQRLKFLEQEELIERIPLSKHEHIARYQLTRKGSELLPIIDDLAQWALRWLLSPVDIPSAPKNPSN